MEYQLKSFPECQNKFKILRVNMIDDKHGVQRTNNEMIDVPEKDIWLIGINRNPRCNKTQ